MYKNKYFSITLLITATIVELCAVFFSVYGLTKLFVGASISVGIMASGLELAKVISTSYLYRFWDSISKIFKIYMSLAVFILMTITSIGIYGFLSNAFQGSTVELEKQNSKLSVYENEISRLNENTNSLKFEKEELKKMRTENLNAISATEKSVYKRESLIKRYQTLISEKDNLIIENNKKIEDLSSKISNIKVKLLDTGVDVGPIIFVSKAFNVGISTVVQYLIFLFIFVFDPLAVALIIAFNKLVANNENELDENDKVFNTPSQKNDKNEIIKTDITIENFEQSTPKDNFVEEIVNKEDKQSETKIKKTKKSNSQINENIKLNYPNPNQTSSF